MGFFSRLREFFFGRGEAAAPSGRVGFGERMRQRRIERQAKRSQKIMEKLEKQQRKEEEKRKKAEDFRKKEEAYNKGRDTFRERWGFSNRDYDNFVQFIASVPDEMKEAFGSENLVEVFRTGKNLGLDPTELKDVITNTYSVAGGTQEDLINEIYFNMEELASQKSEGAYV